METDARIPAALSLDALGAMDARAAFDLAAESGYRGIAFGNGHPELGSEQLGPSARRHLRAVLSARRLGVESIRAAGPRGGLTDPASIDRTLQNARKAVLLARELGVGTVALHVGTLAGGEARVSQGTVVSALRELAQQADAAGLTLALGADQSEALAKLLKLVDFEGAKVNLDGARLIAAGEDVLKTVEWIGQANSIGQFTAADAVRAGKSVRGTDLGAGQLPLGELLELLGEQEFRGPLVVDVRDLADGVAGAQRAAAELRRLMGARGMGRP